MSPSLLSPPNRGEPFKFGISPSRDSTMRNFKLNGCSADGEGSAAKAVLCTSPAAPRAVEKTLRALLDPEDRSCVVFDGEGL